MPDNVTIYDAQGRPYRKPDKGPVAEPDDVIRVVKSAGSSVADALTPQELVSLLRGADQGSLTDQSELFGEMEDRDAKLDGYMRQRKAGVLSCEYEILPPAGMEEDAAAVEIARECADMVRSLAAFRDRTLDLLDAIGKGFAAAEIAWDTSEGQWRPKALEYRPQTWFCLSERGDEIRLRTQKEQIYGEPLNPWNWILHTHRARSGFVPRIGLYRSCARPFVVRNYGWKDWLAFAEVFGMPLRVGYLRQGATSDERSLLWRALQAIGVDAAALIPEGSRLEFPTTGAQGQAAGSVFKDLIVQAEDDYVIATLGQRLTSGGETGGSYALGIVQQNVRWDLVDDDARRLDETLTQQLLLPFVRLNHGADAPAPRWRTKLERPEDLGALSEIVERLSRAGQPIPQRWVSERFGIPLPAEDEPILEAPAADALPPFAGAGPKKKRDGEPNNASNRSPSGTPRLTVSSRTLFGRSA